MKKKRRGKERETTTHLIKIPVFTHASRVTKFSRFILRQRQRSMKFLLVRPDNKALGAFPQIVLKVLSTELKLLRCFKIVSCSSHALAVCADRPKAVSDHDF